MSSDQNILVKFNKNMGKVNKLYNLCLKTDIHYIQTKC